MDELKPCPFCGSTDIARANNGGYGAHWTMCGNCGACTGESGVESQQQADDRWNTRAALAQSAWFTKGTRPSRGRRRRKSF
jgi:Lar family restriction alleviation protein